MEKEKTFKQLYLEEWSNLEVFGFMTFLSILINWLVILIHLGYTGTYFHVFTTLLSNTFGELLGIFVLITFMLGIILISNVFIYGFAEIFYPESNFDKELRIKKREFKKKYPLKLALLKIEELEKKHELNKILNKIKEKENDRRK